MLVRTGKYCAKSGPGTAIARLTELSLDSHTPTVYTRCQNNQERGIHMVKTCSVKSAQHEFPSLLGRVRRKKDTVIVEEQGHPVVAMIPFDRYQALTKRRDRLFAVLDRIWAKNRNIPARDARRDATQAVKQARAARRRRRRLSA